MDFDLSSMLVNKEFVSRINDNIDYNKSIFYYYLKLSSEVKSNKQSFYLQDRAFRLKDCNSVWILDKYSFSNIKDFKKTYLCRDKFCSNCKKVRQAQRIKKYLPLLAEYDKDLYFFTLTVPNCTGENLNNVIRNMNSAFSKLIEYFNFRKKIKGIDFSKFAYKGAIKSLEVSFKLDGARRFHPHFHCAFVFDGYKPGKEYIKNRFSVDHFKRRDLRLFNREVVKLQKIWFLLVNKIEVNSKNLDYCPFTYYDKNIGFSVTKVIRNPGYSVVIDKFGSGQYQEMFKYMIKDKSMDGKNMNYDTFKYLLNGLNNVRQLSGTGVFYNVSEDDDVNLEFKVDKIYNSFIAYLKEKELPVEVSESPLEVLSDSKYIYISRKKIFSYLRKSLLEEKFVINDFVSKEKSSFINYSKFDELINDIISEDEQVAKNKRIHLQKEDEFFKNKRFIVV